MFSHNSNITNSSVKVFESVIIYQLEWTILRKLQSYLLKQAEKLKRCKIKVEGGDYVKKLILKGCQCKYYLVHNKNPSSHVFSVQSALSGVDDRWCRTHFYLPTWTGCNGNWNKIIKITLHIFGCLLLHTCTAHWLISSKHRDDQTEASLSFIICQNKFIFCLHFFCWYN